MRNCKSVFAVMIGLAVLNLTLAMQAEESWTEDMEQAIEKAKAEKKDLLINFTGSDWCIWCKKLEGEVFGKEDFVNESQKHFVLVKLDFPNDKSGQTEDIIKQNTQWKTKFGVSGFPSVYLTDATGRPYAKTGYQPGGPKKYLPHLAQKREVHEKLDAALAKAKKAKGLEKAKLLDEALSLLDEDMVESHYSDLVKQIVKLDSDNTAGLRTKWNGARDEEERREVLAQVRFVQRTQPAKVTLKTVNETLENYRFPIETKLTLLEIKLKMLQATGGQEEAVGLYEDLIADQRIDVDTRERLRERMIYSLVKSKRQDEALALLDGLIDQHPDRRHRLRFNKGELLDRLGQHKEAIVEFDQAIKFAPDEDFQHEVQLAKSDSLASLDKIDDAVALLDDIAKNRDTPRYLLSDTYLQKAMILRDAKRAKDAEPAEAKAIEFADSPEAKAELQKLIEQLRRTN